MAKRYGRVVPDWERTEYRRLDAGQMALVDLFQFMIGGHDWSLVAALPGERCCHNSRLLAEKGAHKDTATGVIPVPYDFDMTGIVNAPYAFPPEVLPIKSVRQRYFRGRCMTDELWQSTLDRFRSRRTAINDLFADPMVSAKLRKRSLAYLDGFYAILDDPGRRQRLIIDRCAAVPAADVEKPAD